MDRVFDASSMFLVFMRDVFGSHSLLVMGIATYVMTIAIIKVVFYSKVRMRSLWGFFVALPIPILIARELMAVLEMTPREGLLIGAFFAIASVAAIAMHRKRRGNKQTFDWKIPGAVIALHAIGSLLIISLR